MKLALMASRLGSAIRISTVVVSCGLAPWYMGTTFTLCPHGVSLLDIPPGYLPVRTIGSTESRLTSVDLLSYLLRTLLLGTFQGSGLDFHMPTWGLLFSYNMRWNQPRHKKGKHVIGLSKHRCPDFCQYPTKHSVILHRLGTWSLGLPSVL